MKRIFVSALAGLGFIMLAAPVPAQEIGDAKKGATFAQMVCAECHAVRRGQFRSPNTKAPTFASIAASPGMTATAIRVWLQTPHPTMPNLLLHDDEKDNVVAYILSIRGR